MALTPTRYIYQRRGQPLYSWAGGPPPQQRGADARTMSGFGSLGDDTFGIQRPLLPRPGAPEFLDDPIDTLGSDYGSWTQQPSSSPPIKQYGLGGVGGKKKACGCGCKGTKKKGCGAMKRGMSEYVGTGEYVGMGDDPTAASGSSSTPAASTPVVVVPAPVVAMGPLAWAKAHPIASLAIAYAGYRLFIK